MATEDKKINEVSTNANADYVIGTLENGSLVRIPKAELAEIVRGLLPMADENNNGFASKMQAAKSYRLNPNETIEIDIPVYGMYMLTSETLEGVSMIFQKAYYSKDLKIVADPGNTNTSYFKVSQDSNGHTIKVTNLSSSISCIFSINRL